MEEVIIVFERPDIAAAAALQARLPAAAIWVFDPHLLDDLAAAGLPNARYIEYSLGLSLPGYVAEMRRLALSMEARIDKVLARHIPEVIGSHWQYLNFFHLVQTLTQYAKLWEIVLDRVSADVHFHIPIHDVPATYYLHSFLPAIGLLEQIVRRNGKFSAYSHSRVDAVARYIPAAGFPENAPRRGLTFTHLPTCIYDSRYFEAEINAGGMEVLNFPSQNWNVPLDSFRSLSLCYSEEASARLKPHHQAAITETYPAIQQELAAIFRNHIHVEEYAQRQAAHLADQYKAQMVFYFFLAEQFSNHPPQKLILSNHDSGLHGPFISFCKSLNIPITLLPHAKIFNYPIPSSYKHISALTHPVQGGAVTNIEGKQVNWRFIDFPERKEIEAYSSPALKRIGLLLNKFSIDGISLVDTQTYLAGIRKILAWCRDNGVVCRLRAKPGGSCVRWLAAELDLDAADLTATMAGSLVDYAKDVDLCLMYDAPTSGAIDFLRHAAPIFNVVVRPLCAEEAHIVDSELVPRLPVDEMLERLAVYSKDIGHLQNFRNRQFAKYCARFGETHSLRASL